MIWRRSNRFDPPAAHLADRHYNRQKPGTPQFVPPGRCLVLLAESLAGPALWVTSWPRYVQHAWPTAWVNTLFRNEGAGLSSDLIRQAIAATRFLWPAIPAPGIVTFIDASKIHHKRDPGRCYIRAGFHHVGYTGKGLHVFQMLGPSMPLAQSWVT